MTVESIADQESIASTGSGYAIGQDAIGETTMSSSSNQSEIKVKTQGTPNPNAKKFIASLDVKQEGKASFTTTEDCAHIDLARELFLQTNVTQVHFFENIITLTQNGMSDWQVLTEKTIQIIKRLLPEHNSAFQTADEKHRESLPEEVQRVEDILDRYIRPSLRMDGGDVEVVEVDGLVISIRYEGACGSCPSSQMGTLEAIRGALQEEYHPEVDVVAL